MGGAAGHLAHLYDDVDLTFAQLGEALRGLARGEVETFEKVDGQNLFFTWSVPTGELRTARNPGDIRRGGMRPEEYAAKWRGHPAEAAFTEAFEAIRTVVAQCNPDDPTGIWGPDGDRWVNAEILHSAHPNMIQYTSSHIVLHNMQSARTPEESVAMAFRQLLDAVAGARVHFGPGMTWHFRAPLPVDLTAHHRDGAAEARLRALVEAVEALAPGRLGSATVGAFITERLRAGEVGALRLARSREALLIQRLLGLARGTPASELTPLRDIKRGLDAGLGRRISALATSSTYHRTITRAVAPLAQLVGDFGVELLRGVHSRLVGCPEAEVGRLRGEVRQACEKLGKYEGRDSGRVAELLAEQSERLGPLSNITSTLEGVVFRYPPGRKRLYKLTGAFAPVNQLVGRARRLGPSEAQVFHPLAYI